VHPPKFYLRGKPWIWGVAQNGIFGFLPQKRFCSSDFSRFLPKNVRLKPLLQKDFLSYVDSLGFSNNLSSATSAFSAV